MTPKPRWCLAALIALSLGGCGKEESNGGSVSRTNQPQATSPSTDSCCPGDNDAAAAPKVELKVANYKQLTDAIAAHKGKVVVIDLWAHW